MFGFLPTILWWRDRYYRGKSDLFKFVCSLLITLHIILHIEKALANAQPTGKYQIISTDNIENIKRLTIVRCQQTSVSQKYEKIVGLDLAKQYPQLKINVITEGDITNNYPQTDLILKGTDLKGKEKNLCIFEIDI